MAAELPFHLKTIEPLRGALDIIRFLDSISEPTADVDTICDTLDLSDRSFSKAIRRLVTKGYVVMEGEMIYRLTEQGNDAAKELHRYDEATGGGLGAMVSSIGSNTINKVGRRFIMALPAQLVAGKPADLHVGVREASNGNINGTTEMVARVEVINGTPDSPEDLLFSLGDASIKQIMQITPSGYTEVRIRVKVFQLGDNPGEIHDAGGMYVDIPVTTQGSNQAPLTAFGTDIQIVI